MKTQHLSYASDYKAGDRVVVKPSYDTTDPMNAGLEPGKVYTVESVGTYHEDGPSGGVLFLQGETNSHSITSGDRFEPGGFGFMTFEKVIDLPVSEASDVELIEALQGRGYTGTLSHHVMTVEEVTL